MSSLPRTALGVTVLALGFFCLNYTNGFSIAHHAEWAKEHGAPEPAYSIFVLGAVVEALGAGIVGYGIGRRRRA